MSHTTSGSTKKKLLDAAVEGDLGMMSTLLNEDPCILDRVSYKKSTPLHLAAIKGHLSLVKKMLSCNQQLAEELDAHQSSPLHVASSNGHLEIVRELLRAAPEICLSQDCHGRNPVHVAAMEGQLEVLKELVEKHPIAAREKTDGGFTLLHLCLKYKHLHPFKELMVPKYNLSDLLDCKDHDGNNFLHMAARYGQVEFLKELVEKQPIAAREKTDGGLTLLHLCLKYQHLHAFKELMEPKYNLSDLLDCKDHDGNNVLHMAARYRQVEIVYYLVKYTKIDRQAMNLQGQTARMILQQTQISYDRKLLSMLKPKGRNDWITEQRNAIMVVAILIATMAFQAGVTPPGGVLQNEVTKEGHKYKIGEAVMAYTGSSSYKAFMNLNTGSLVASLSVILVLVSGLPLNNKAFVWMLIVAMWITISHTVATYITSIIFVTPSSIDLLRSLSKVIILSATCWLVLLLVLVSVNLVRFVHRMFQSVRERIMHITRPKQRSPGGEVAITNIAIE